MYNQIFKGSLSNVFKIKMKILSEVINSNYAVIYFKPDGTIIKANEVFENYGLLFRGDCRKHPLFFCEKNLQKLKGSTKMVGMM